MGFAVATCPECQACFRLVWKIGGHKLQPTALIRLTCPECKHTFEQTAVKLYVFSSGLEEFPSSVVVLPENVVKAD